MKRNCDRSLLELPQEQETIEECTLFTDYRPKPGGQTRVFEEFLNFGVSDRTTDINPDYRGLYIRGGRGGGKSHIGAAIACSRAYYDPASRGLISANEYGQLETSTLVALAEFCEQFNVPIYPKGETVEDTARMIARRRLCQIFDAQVLVLAASKFGGSTEKTKQGGRGIQCRWAWLDEWATADRIAVNVLNAALGRGSGTLDGFFWITSTINLQTPYNWCYELFDDPDRTEDKRELYKSVVLLSRDNDALPESFVKTLESSYTPEMIAIELRGEYATNKDGLAVNHFSRDRHVAPVTLLNTPLHLSCDFNRSPCSSVIFQVHESKIIVIEEIHILEGDTFALASEICDRLLALLPQLTDKLIHVHGDASGKAMTANSQQSNWQIIWKALGTLGVSTQRRYKESNPPVIDTLNSLNALCAHDRLIVSPQCKELIKDLESCKLVITPSGRVEIDKKSDPKRSHWLDCARYMVFDEFPITKVGAIATPTGAPLNIPKHFERSRVVRGSSGRNFR